MLNQAVNQDNTTISVVSSLNPSVYVQAVTISAVVSAMTPGSGIPTKLHSLKQCKQMDSPFRSYHCAAEAEPIGLPRIVMPSGRGRPATVKLLAISSARRRR